MAKLYVIRHGQASFLAENYDQLSDLGYQQARALGEFWRAQDINVDLFIVGPRKRHQQTLDGFLESYNETKTIPVQTIKEFDEYPADAVMKAGITQILPQAVHLAPDILEFQKNGSKKEQSFQKIFEHVTYSWIRGELLLDDVESFAQFRGRVANGVDSIVQTANSRESIAVFTSGGPVAATVGHILNLDDEKTLELSWMVRNSAYNEFVFSGERISMLSFANIAHLDSPEMLTFR